NIYETNDIDEQELKLIAEEYDFSFEKLIKFIKQFNHAKAIGSLLKIEEFDEFFLNDVLIKIESGHENLFNYHMKDELIGVLKQLIKQVKVMTAKYDVTVTNPPYAGNKYLPSELTQYLDKEYPNTKSDIFSAFIEYTFELTKESGQMGYLTPFVWMFISTYEKLRETIIQSKNISSLVQLEYNGFEAAMVPVCMFTLRNYKVDKKGEYIRLESFKGIDNQYIKTLEAVKNPNSDYRYSFNQNQLNLIPGKPIAYWASDNVVNAFKNSEILSNIGFSKKGLDTGKNDLYLRHWFEVSKDKINKKWFPLNKGGSYRKWYGNQNYLIDWENNGEKLKSLKSANIRNERFYFKESIGWSDLTSGDFGARYYPDGFIFEATGPSFFCKNIMETLGYMNSNVFNYFAKFTMSTMHYTNGSVAKMPYKKLQVDIEKIVEENVEISKDDWDSFENSMDFIVHPFLKYSNNLLEDTYLEWEKYKEHQYHKLKVNEEFLNEVFIELYNLNGELSPIVDEKKIVIK
ncbi:Eco57I restriction-modification methylase domain-containing protein, partial [Metasolibacillus meyeri]|uniref:Eco57I restriction-modification methylase domain-containing protein n=1 Tax=Metasolibacillus meyeri TaxID=1071052 RepID=UPI0012901A8C